MFILSYFEYHVSKILLLYLFKITVRFNLRIHYVCIFTVDISKNSKPYYISKRKSNHTFFNDDYINSMQNDGIKFFMSPLNSTKNSEKQYEAETVKLWNDRDGGSKNNFNFEIGSPAKYE